MTWAVVARKDFADARRSRALWALTIMFVGLTVLAAYLYSLIPSLDPEAGAELSAVGLLGTLAPAATLFIAISAVVIGYKSIAGETESGSGKLLLGLPNTRRDVVLGKVAGRTAVLALAVVLGLVAAFAVIIALYQDVSVVEYVTFGAATVLFALAYVSIVVGLSATTTSTSRAAVYAVGAFFLFEILWETLVTGLVLVVYGFDLSSLATLPNWALFLVQLAPSGAYQNLAAGVLSNSLVAANGSVPIYLQSWVGFVILVLWATVPLVLGYLRYRRADL